MKKLVFGIAILLFAAACDHENKTNNEKKQTANKINQQAKRQDPPGITLDGIGEAKATGMINNFESRFESDVNTTKTFSVWYSRDDIVYMNNLLVNDYNHKKKNEKPDGVRIYFGCNDPALGTGTKLTPVTYFVTTKTRLIHDSTKSDHEDYYYHIDNTLPNKPLGNSPVYDANVAFKQGALLYDKGTPNDIPCAKPNGHYINGADAYQAVRKHRQASSIDVVSQYDTRAEWFDICFINSLFNAILNNENGLNGLRIYFGRRIMKIKGKDIERDVLILVPTHSVRRFFKKVNEDSYKCLEDLKSFSCTYDWTKAFNGDKEHDSHITFLKVAGYDKGELCPTNCN